MNTDDTPEEGLHRVNEHLLEASRDPTSAELEVAPYLDLWRFTQDWLGYTLLIGKVSGHPLLEGPSIYTSPLLRIDPFHEWARTYSRFYRLGTRQPDTDETSAGSNKSSLSAWAESAIARNIALIRRRPWRFRP